MSNNSSSCQRHSLTESAKFCFLMLKEIHQLKHSTQLNSINNLSIHGINSNITAGVTSPSCGQNYFTSKLDAAREKSWRMLRGGLLNIARLENHHPQWLSSNTYLQNTLVTGEKAMEGMIQLGTPVEAINQPRQGQFLGHS